MLTRSKLYWRLILAFLLFQSCETRDINAILPPENIVISAPSAAQIEKSFIVNFKNQSLQEIEKIIDELSNEFPHIQYRSLDNKTSIEIRNVKQEHFKKQLLPYSTVEANQIFRLARPRASVHQLLSKQPVELADFQNCDFSKPDLSPDAQIDVPSHPGLEKTLSVLYQNTKIELNTNSPAIDPMSNQEVQYLWLLGSAPRTSKILNAYSTNRTWTIEIDSLGEYEISLISRVDGSKYCGLDDFEVGSTYHRAYSYSGPGNLPGWSAARRLSFFSHLYDIEAIELSFEETPPIIAILDSGISYNHPHLSSKLATKGTRPLGFNFIHGQGLPLDDEGHGTHVAGLAAGLNSGVAPQAKILSIKVMTAVGTGDTATIAKGIFQAVDSGARIINLSLGASVYKPAQILVDAIAYAQEQNVVVVAAAGNESSDNDSLPIYPASFNSTFDNVISVAALNGAHTVASYSNWGRNSVDIVAPGGEFEDPLLSCDYLEPQKGLLVSSIGTSMATPLVSAAVALTQMKNPTVHQASSIIKILIENSKTNPRLKNWTKSGRELNIKFLEN